MADPFLIGESMTGGYGATDILHDCTIAVEKGQIAVIVGPNGAGKSTAMKAVFGMLNLRGGAVRLNGEDITKLSPQDRVARGMAFVPQTHNNFTSMTVESSDKGPNPKSGVVEQKNALTGAFPADAMCNGPESLTKFRLASFIKAADCIRLSFPAKLCTLLRWLSNLMPLHSSWSAGPPNK